VSARGTVSPADLLRLGVFGLRTRPARVVLSALGIAIGIAAMIAVVGISSSSKAEVDRVLDTLGTNVLTVTQADGFGETPPLPDTALESVQRQDDVESAAAVGTVPDTGVYRNGYVPAPETKGIGVLAAWGDVPAVLGGELASGRWIDDARTAAPQVVLGNAAAVALGIDEVRADSRIWIGGQWVQVVGILRPLALAADLDNSAFVPRALAGQLGFDGAPTAVYTRIDPARVEQTRDLLAGPVRPRTSVSPDRPMPWPPRTPPTTPSPDCSSASAVSRCSSGASASPTRW
jgi:putative ABC transport system permease protein